MAGRYDGDYARATVGALRVGVATGRLISFVLDRTRGSTVVWSFLLLELALALALLGSCALR